MPQVLKPSWGLFERLVATAKEDLIICTPWISSAGVQRLRGLLRNDPHGGPLQKVQLWARIADINTDSPGILELVRTLGAARISTVVRDSPVLHAKIYLADRALALVTSANLSEGGFSENLEAAVVISEPEGVQQVVQLLAGIEAETALVSITDLEYFVAEERPLLEEQAVPEAPPATIPVWRRRVQSSRALSEEPLAGPGKESGQSKPVDLMEVIQWVKASLQAAQNEIQHVDLRCKRRSKSAAGSWV
jgi:hypothetical protein